MRKMVETNLNEAIRALVTRDELESLEALRSERLKLMQAELAKLQPIVEKMERNLTGEMEDLEAELTVRRQDLTDDIESLSALSNLVSLYP